MRRRAKCPWGAALAALLAASASGLSGCNENSYSVQPGPEGASAALDEKFGEGFATMSRASANSKPRDVAAADLPPVSLTEKPVEF